MTDHANELRRYSRKIGHPAGDVPSVMLAAAEEIERLAERLEAAEKDVALKEQVIDALGLELNAVAKECDALRSKIEAMERQEPVAWMLNCPTLGGDTGWILSWTQSGAGLCNRLSGEENEKKLYALPGAQPELNLSDPAIQKRLAAQWGYVPAGAQPAPSVPDEIERDVLRACCGTFHGSRHRITCEKHKGKREPGDKP